MGMQFNYHEKLIQIFLAYICTGKLISNVQTHWRLKYSAMCSGQKGRRTKRSILSTQTISIIIM